MIISIILNKNNINSSSKKYRKNLGEVDDKNETPYRLPKLNNPFMNLNMFNISNTKKPASPSFDNPVVKNEIENIFNHGLSTDTSDIYANNNSQNRFYTMPNTMPYNKQSEFADWCFKTPKTCKEGNGVDCSNNLYDNLL